MKNKRKNATRQTNLPKFLPIISEIVEAPVEFFSTFSAIELDILNRLIKYQKTCKAVFPSQVSLARDVGCSRAHVNRFIKKLTQWGILYKKQRWNTSCLYMVSSFFDLSESKQKLKKLLPALWALPLVLLASFMPSVTLTNIEILGKEFYRSTALKRKLMDNQAVIRADIERIKFKSIELTRMGKVKLMAFTTEVVSAALEKLRNAKDVRNPYQYLYKLCLEQSEIENIDPDFAYVGYLCNYFGLAADDPDFTTKGKDENPLTGFKHMNAQYAKKTHNPQSMYTPWKEHNTTRYHVNRSNRPLSEVQQKKASEFLSILGENNASKVHNSGRALFSNKAPSL